jgi:hypothetical protein
MAEGPGALYWCKCSAWAGLRLFAWWVVAGRGSWLYRKPVRCTNLAVFSEQWNRTASSAGTRTPQTRNRSCDCLTYLLTDFHGTWQGRCGQKTLQCVALHFHASSNNNMVDARNRVEEWTLAALLHGHEMIYATGPQSLHSFRMSLGLCI